MSQATVQAPPGLEGQSHQALDIDVVKELRESIVKEVTERVTETCMRHLESTTQATVDALYKRGQKAVTYMQQQQSLNTEQLQSEIQRCAESCRRLEGENAVLRANLEALMRHLTVLFGAPPLRPSAPSTSEPAVTQALDELETASVPVHRDPDTDEVADVAAGSGESGSPASTQAETPSETPGASEVFTLTLRRADTVPVGLHVTGEDGLLVERVLPGGAVEAWNRQCPGVREIRVGDRIVSINGQDDAEAMRTECLSKYLLRMTVQRGSGLRAEADEFVPQA
mmetsp:Transcript_59868/g.142999  ORF Transcript_59868/g.142999 Transcript_59868/m.142999 type:complete len:284 (-) Transcript_59868:176-1027(-)|eukprot:CAMPEP_0181464380 /NCGR_PEP_ID=MMETSP1110-20121109/35405_1 /TAXON_ID=174948 /ORGANISM="Symbiodinium sp., Strain CCMP421" /LENGTH=283 /DNA_ID=CAMNT_0023589117 /DNA_START=54 /DNA_END=905 /DNA_ORIENTATION=-